MERRGRDERGCRDEPNLPPSLFPSSSEPDSRGAGNGSGRRARRRTTGRSDCDSQERERVSGVEREPALGVEGRARGRRRRSCRCCRWRSCCSSLLAGLVFSSSLSSLLSCSFLLFDPLLP